MLTPNFTVDQDDEFVYIKVKIANIRFSAQSVEMYSDGDLFIFSLPPYYLRLRFPGRLVEDERATSRFVPKGECVEIRVPKETKGEHFEDLDLTTKLLARLKVEPKVAPKTQGVLIEEVDSEVSTGPTEPGKVEESIKTMAKEAEDFDWEVEQKPETLNTSQPKYGFNDQYAGMLNHTVGNGNDINELTDPDNLEADARIMQRLIKENLKFDPEYYANEYLTAKFAPEDCQISQILAWESPFKIGHTIEFTKEEQERMNNLPKKSYLIDDPRPLYYTVVSMLFAYMYDLRSNEGESTVESAWTIGKLAPQICCVDSQLVQSNNSTETSMLKVIVLTMDRRALSYPLIRNYELVQKCWQDVYTVLRCGTRGVLKALMSAREFFRFHDVYYVYCLIWLDDLCNWVLRDCNEKVLRNLAHALREQVSVTKKEDLVFEKAIGGEELEFVNLVEVEELALESYKLAQGREQQESS